MLRHYPTVPPVMFGAREFAIFRMKMTPILTVVNMSEFFDYLIENWRVLRETRFVWLRVQGKDVAVAPSLPELMRFWKVFAQAFSDSRMGEAENKAKATLTAEQESKIAIRAAKAAQARAEQEAKNLKIKLAKVERIAYAPIRKTRDEPVQSLTERREAAEAAFKDDTLLPEWK